MKHLLASVAMISAIIAPFALAENRHAPSEAVIAHKIKLSPQLHHLLRAEMGAVQKAVVSLVPAIASGDWATIEATANNIHNSFIMKQKLTNAQRSELKHVLPADFVARDQDFHRTAKMLAHVAKNKHAELVSFYYYKMIDACMGCHARYAADRFPSLAPAEAAATEHQH